MLLYILALIVAVVAYFKYFHPSVADHEILAKYYGDRCWCKAEEVIDTEIHAFKIAIPDSELADLNKRIDETRFPTPALDDSKFIYGVNSNYMRELAMYWRETYSWRDQEEKMNKFNHFKTKIEGLDIHFVHLKPKTMSVDNQPKPILLCHGWPGSFYEFLKIIPMLTDPSSYGGNETDLFEVIVPSIPGYGFSQAPELMGFNSLHCARIFHKLMQRIGHKKYYLQGGDWGSLICTHMAMLYPSAVKGLHLNWIFNNLPIRENLRLLIGAFAPTVFYNQFDAKKLFPLKRLFKIMLAESGFLHLQATKPDTIGFALSDSPVGLAAYILEKFSAWTDINGRNENDGGITKFWTNDQLLTNIMIYWFSGNITSSMRFYKESIGDPEKTGRIKVRVPAAYAWFPNELMGAVKGALKVKFARLLSFTYFKEGGHFAALQVPHLLAEDLRQFVRKIEKVKESEEKDEAEFAQNYRQTHLDRFNTS